MCRCRSLITCAIIVAVLAWLFRFYPWQWHVRDTDPPPVSYDGRIIFNLNHIETPSTEAEIVQIVKNAYDNNRKVRVVAAGHSWSKIAQTEDIMISLHKYSGLEDVDEQNLLVTVKAGTRLEDLSFMLEGRNLAMINLGSVARQSIAGAMSTATHGTGLEIGNLAALATRLRFVSGTGEIVTVGEDDDDQESRDIFKAAQVSIGMFGVLSEVTLRVERKFYLRELRTSHDLKYCLDNMDKLVKTDGYVYVKMWMEFYNDFCILYSTNKTDDEVHETPGWVQSFLTYYTFAITTRVCYIFPSLTPYMMWLVNRVGFGANTDRKDISYRIFNDYFDLPIHAEAEIIVDYKDTVAAIETLRDVILENEFPVNYITEVRFVSGDDTWLSPYYGMEDGACAITLTIYAPRRTAKAYFDAYYLATRRFRGRIHWGKHFTIDRSVVERWYPKFPEFALIRKKMDPKGIFLNRFLRETFGFKDNN